MEMKSDETAVQKTEGDTKLTPSAIGKQIGVTSAISLSYLVAGVIFGYTGITLPSVTDPKSDDIYMTTEQVSLYTSMLVIGCLIGSILTGPLSIKYGQRVALLSVIPLAITGWIISYFAHTFWLHLISRVCLGVFISTTLALTSTYIAETAHSSIRGRLVAISDLARQFGFLFVYIVGSTNMNWRTVGLVCGLTPLAIPCICLLLLPSSPRWLAVVGLPEQRVKDSLQFFRGKNYNIQEEFSDIQEDISKSKDSSTYLNQLKRMREKPYVKIFALLVYLNFAVNFTGDFTISSYSVTIFQSAGTGFSAYKSTILCGVLRVCGASLYIALADRIGRRPQLMVFISLSAVCTAILGGYFYLIHIKYDTSTFSWLPLVSLALFTFCNCLFFPVFQLLRSELLPNSLRSLGISILYFVLCVAIFIIGSTYPLIAEYFGPHWAFWLYSSNSIMMVVIIYFFLPETKGKTLEEIAKLF